MKTEDAEQPFRALVTATTDVVYRMNADWTEMRYLQGRDFIADTREPSRTWVEKYIHPDDQPSVLATVQEAIRTKSTFELEHRVIRVDGSLGWTFSRAVPILDSKGRIVEWFGMAGDVTKRKQAEEDLARLTARSEHQRRLYETILSNTPDLVYVFDLNHRFSYANEALLTMWGKTWDEAIGKTCLELGYEPWHAAMHDREIDQVIATRKPIRGEVPFNGTHGRRIYDYIFVPVLGTAGDVEAVAGTTRDVTDNNRVQEELQQLMQREQAARVEAESASRLKDEFLAVVSHELRTPLTAMLGWVHMLRRGQIDGAKAGHALETVERNTRALTQIIDDLLDVSRIITGKLRIDVQKINPVAVTEAAVEALKPAATAKEVDLRHVVSSRELTISADPDRLQQIVWNLVSNAIKFTPSGGTVEIQVRHRDSHVEIVVADTGAGISSAFLPFVFDRFRQSDGSTTRRHGGLGLGLAVVRHLVELHGGTVRAESAGEGKGATFTVALPTSI